MAMILLPCFLLSSITVFAQNENQDEFDKTLAPRQEATSNEEKLSPKKEVASDQNDTTEKDAKKAEDGIDWAFWLSVISLVVSFGAMYVAIANHKGMKATKKSLSNSKSDLQPSGVKIKIPQKDFEDLKNKVIKEAIKELEGKKAKTSNSKNNQQKDNKTQQHPNSTQTTVSQQTSEKPSTNVKEEKQDNVVNGYFENPIGDSEVYFNKFATEETPRTRFTVERRENEATFNLNSSITVDKVISSDTYQSAIEFVCDGIPKQEAKFMTTESGKAELRDDKWVVTKKMKVFLKK